MIAGLFSIITLRFETQNEHQMIIFGSTDCFHWWENNVKTMSTLNDFTNDYLALVMIAFQKRVLSKQNDWKHRRRKRASILTQLIKVGEAKLV